MIPPGSSVTNACSVKPSIAPRSISSRAARAPMCSRSSLRVSRPAQGKEIPRAPLVGDFPWTLPPPFRTVSAWRDLTRVGVSHNCLDCRRRELKRYETRCLSRSQL